LLSISASPSDQSDRMLCFDATVLQICYDADSDFTIIDTFPEFAIGGALARSEDSVAIIDEDNPLYNQLWLYYGVAPLRDPTTFQILVAALFYRDPMDMPDALVELHRKHVTEEVEFDKTIPEEEKANEIQRRCNKTESVFEQRYRDPLFTECRYFHVCFRRLASIIEGNLLLNNCSKDLFAYQKETDIVLYPSLRADEIAYEMNMIEAEVKKLAGGYTRLDYFTEFAGYGKNFDSVIILGVDISGFPELDSLLL